MIKSKLPEVGTTIFSVMSALAQKHQAVNLSQGFPDFEIDPELKGFVAEGLEKEQVQYAPMPGRQDLREAICASIQKERNVSVDPTTEITLTAGATQGIYTTISTVVNEGDEVILFDPAYDCYAPAVTINGGKPIHINLKHPSYEIDWRHVENRITPRTRLIIVNNPHNPTGAVWKKADLEALENIIINHPNVLVLSDEVYEHLQLEGTHYSILDSDILRKRSFVTYSFGKSLHATGWKLGYCIAPEYLMAEFRKVHQYLVFCVNSTMQYGIARYLESGVNWKEIAQMYARKKALFLEGIAKSRFKVIPGGGTYFCLLDYSAISDMSDVAFAKELTIEHGVAVIPVSVFYRDKSDHRVIRVCFAKKDETLTLAAERLCKI